MDVVLLAGGHSRRMGRDKARLELDGQPLVVHVARRLAALGGRVIVASGDGRRLDAEIEVADAPGVDGPLAGILAGLAVARTPYVALAAVDAPDASVALYRRLAAAASGRAGAVPVSGHGPEPLHAVLCRDAGAALADLARTGERSPRRAVGRLDVVVVRADGWSDLDPDGAYARDWDRPEDLPDTVSLG